MDDVKFPINSTEVYFIAMAFSMAAYFGVSALTFKKPFNLEQMLHRGKYAIDGENKHAEPFHWRTLFRSLIGITPEYTRGDKIIAWSVFLYSFVYTFCGTFLGVVVWNFFSPWPAEWWSTYFLLVFLLVPGVVAVFSTFWFTIGGIIDLRQLFIDLKKRRDDPYDNGWVEGHVSLSDIHRHEDDPTDKEVAGDDKKH